MAFPSFPSPDWIRERRAAALVASLLVALGCALRIVGAGRLLIFGDEVHSITWAIGQRADWLAPYAPLGLWNELAMHTVGLDEWMLRLPSLVGGCLALALIAALAVRHLPAFEAIALTGFVALSPYLVYLTREARTYSLVLLLTTACGAEVLGWLARPALAPSGRGAGGRLAVAALCGAAAVVLHTAVAPTVAVLGAAAILESARRRELRVRARPLAAAAILFVALLVIGVGPNASGVLANVQTRVGASAAGISTVVDALRFGLSLPDSGQGALARTLAWATGILGLIGALRLGRRFPLACTIVVAAFAAQVGVLLLLQPTMLSVPWILLRYLAHALPAAALAVVSGLAAPLGAIRGPARATAGVALAALACLLFGLHHASEARYGALAGASQTLHPILQQAQRATIAGAANAVLPRFYREVLPGLAPGALVEAPLVMTYPLFALYQRAHGRDFYGAALGPGVFQHAGRAAPGLRLARALDVDGLPPAPGDAAYLVVHKRPAAEIARASTRFRVAATTNHRIDATVLGHVFQHAPVTLPETHALRAARVYEDEVVEVYALGTTAAANLTH